MGLFDRFKKEKKEEVSCSSCSCGQEARVKVLGSGCARCQELEEATKLALVELDMDPRVDHVKDFEEIAKYGVMSTPALVVDGQVVSSGRVLNKDQVVEILREFRG